MLAAIWTICLIVASLQPFRPSATSGAHSYGHQIEHVIVFGLTALIYRARTRKNWMAITGVVVLAIFIETAQLALYRMPAGFEWWDVRDDSIGAVIAVLISSLL